MVFEEAFNNLLSRLNFSSTKTMCKFGNPSFCNSSSVASLSSTFVKHHTSYPCNARFSAQLQPLPGSLPLMGEQAYALNNTFFIPILLFEAANAIVSRQAPSRPPPVWEE